MVSGQRFLDSLRFHQQETHRVAKRIGLVGSLSKKVKGLLVKATVYPDDFDTRVTEKTR